ncbi:MAG: FtsX-like permease family protein [Amoebophilaceae bacterium]|nr:FtsX-like permease family protein [Amoebophilaceae bacterium]
MRNSLLIAKRYANKKSNKTLVHKLSQLARYSIALATTILILVLSTMRGINNLLFSLFNSYTPVLKIEPKKSKTFIRNPLLKESIENIADIQTIVENLEATVCIAFHKQQTLGLIKGVSPNFSASGYYKNAITIDRDSFCATKHGKYGGVIDLYSSKRLRLPLHEKNSTIAVLYPKKISLNTTFAQPYLKKSLWIHGVFNTPHIEDRCVITPIHFVEELTGRFHERTSWEVVLKETTKEIYTIQAQIQKLLPATLKVANRYEQNQLRQKAIAMERLSVYFICSLVLLLASLHIFFMLSLLLIEKKHEIITLYSMGAQPQQISRMILYHAMLISLEGMAYGTAIAWVLGTLQQKFGFITLTALKKMGTIPYPIELQTKYFLYTALLTGFFSFLAALWPAKQARQWINNKKVL